MWANALNYLYIFLVVVLSVYGLHALVITTLYLLRFRKKAQKIENPPEWPLVAVQLPLYNEKNVAERMIDTVCAFDYPKNKLIIQVLDDSTDQTTELVARRVEHYRSLGFRIELLHRTDRTGYKASALAAGMEQMEAEFVAVFDADFVPGPDYLRRVIPVFYTDPKLGVVQARWGHLNRDTNLVTRTQALFLDGHQVVQQVARSRSGLLLNFNGSGGVWRAECIRDSGGWTWDTFAEDLDLSYRAQAKGWRITFLPDLIVPAEIPPTMTSFKKQQYRWTYGHIQVCRKMWRKMWTEPGLTFGQRLDASMHLATNFAQLAALMTFLLSVPLALLHPQQPSSLGLISLASSGPAILFAISQIFGYKDGVVRKADRLILLPLLILQAIGMTISNTGAVLGAMIGHPIVWTRTPKYNLEGKKSQWQGRSSGQAVPLTVWLEIAVSIYCAIALSFALRFAPEIISMAALGMLSFGYVGCTSLVDYNKPKKASSVAVDSVEAA